MINIKALAIFIAAFLAWCAICWWCQHEIDLEPYRPVGVRN